MNLLKNDNRCITAKITSGLGNQFFQYANAYALSQKNNSKLFLDISSFKKDNLRTFELGHYHVPYDALTEKPNNPFINIFNKNTFIEKNFYYNETIQEVTPPIYLKGYFQSFRYFEDYSKDIRNFFLKDFSDKKYQFLKNKILKTKNATSIHIRRGDFLLPIYKDKFITCSMEYYQKAIDLMTKIYQKDCFFYVFTDDVEWVEENFIKASNITIISDPKLLSDREELSLMAYCKNNIIANSTYSWWGAWLNPNFEKTIIAPRQWFSINKQRNWNTCDLIPPKWITI